MGQSNEYENFLDVIDAEKGNRIVRISSTILPGGYGSLNSAHGLGTPYLVTLNSHRLVQIYNIFEDPTQHFTNSKSKGITYFIMMFYLKFIDSFCNFKR